MTMISYEILRITASVYIGYALGYYRTCSQTSIAKNRRTIQCTKHAILNETFLGWGIPMGSRKPSVR